MPNFMISEPRSAVVSPGRGLVVLHREEQNPVVFAMSTSYTVVAFATILAVAFIAFQLLSRRQLLRRGPAWAGGLRHLWPEITYTAPGFSNRARHLRGHPPACGGRGQRRSRRKAFSGGNQAEPHGGSHRRPAGARPLDRFHGRAAAIVRKMHVGNVNAYAAYVLLTILFVLIVGAGLI